MTRETKIGLLVGLAFIIVIGILLSDHLTSSTEPPQAALAGAGNNVRQAVANPGTAAPQLPPAQAPTNPAPSQQVPTRDELTPALNPTTIVKVGPSETPARPQTMTNEVSPPSNSPQNNPPADPTISRVPASGNPLSDVAKQHGEELELVDSNGHAIHGKLAARTGTAEYKAQAGDSLSKMASRLMGSNSKKNRDAIVAANPSLKNDPNKVIVGRTYVIPSASDEKASPAPAATPSAAPTEASSKSAPTDADEYFYTVKSGDSLWKIATEQCGRSNAVAALKELNKEILVGDGHDQVVAGMKLRLPGKPVTN